MKKIFIIALFISLFCSICSAKTIYSDNMLFSVIVPDNWKKITLGTDGTESELLTVQGPNGSYVSLKRNNIRVPVMNYKALNQSQKETFRTVRLNALVNMFKNKRYTVVSQPRPSATFYGDNLIGYCLFTSVFVEFNNLAFSYSEQSYIKNYVEYKIEQINTAIGTPYAHTQIDQLTDITNSLCINNTKFDSWALYK